MKKALYHLSGASLLVGVWRALLWLFAWPLALIGVLHRRRERREQRLLGAIEALKAEQPAVAVEKSVTIRQVEGGQDYEIPAWMPAGMTDKLTPAADGIARWQARMLAKRFH